MRLGTVAGLKVDFLSKVEEGRGEHVGGCEGGEGRGRGGGEYREVGERRPKVKGLRRVVPREDVAGAAGEETR